MNTLQFSSEQAAAFRASGAAKIFTAPQLAWLQMNQECLLVDINEFKDALSITLGQPIVVSQLRDTYKYNVEALLTERVCQEDKDFVDRVISSFVGSSI